MFSQWFGKSTNYNQKQLQRRSRPFGRKLFLKVLEDRTLLSPLVLTVNSLGDSGTGTGSTGDLRYCIHLANQNHNPSRKPDQINFASGLSGTVTLQLGQLLITDPNLVINGPGASTIAVSGNNSSRVFDIASSSTVSIDGLTIEDGQTVGDGTNDGSNKGGGIFNQGALTLQNDTISGNKAVGQPGANGTSTSPNGGNGGNAQGGGVCSAGSLTLVNDVVANNAAIGGAGGLRAVRGRGNGGAGGSGLGGGVYSSTGQGGPGQSLFNSPGSVTGSGGLGGQGGQGGDGGNGGIAGNGGNGGDGGTGGDAQGGGLYVNSNQDQLLSLSISHNVATGGTGGIGGAGGDGAQSVGGDGGLSLVGNGGNSGNGGRAGSGGNAGNGGTGGNALGGGLYARDEQALLDQPIITDNTATGGNGGAGGTGGNGGTSSGGSAGGCSVGAPGSPG